MTCEQECERILAIYGEADRPAIVSLLERQFAVLTARSQVLLGLAGVVVTTTGFSGRLIAGTNVYAQVLVISGLALVMGAAAVVVFGVLHLKWLTQHEGELPRQWMLCCLRYRNRKMRFYRAGVMLLLAGLLLYVGAIGVMLLEPRAFDLGVGR